MVSGRKKEWDFMDMSNKDADYDGMGDFSRMSSDKESSRYRQGRRKDQVDVSEMFAGWGITMLILLVIMLIFSSGS